ncbi:hypothetical protein KC332_g10315 [Hortaea werneckii]|uniref:Uncharacterized protein n=2 Tax=Hortaea werneckii TaxID=91943 RepID=A0A3M7I0W4_HORWE|nr:hypothetical protein KC358_g10939 [Hortaea werneckii]OTA31265.1 hypothetical protein BTJ68_09117 [Hortaea werneckii EXF-2000]KAI6818125.1 hypothetical protein KC350_g10408 [Hortaea werneckii]KAI6920733.1 hypothetical protein KC348_g10313 [Hortaea werneckii]KAI6930899.1 hypothetical protein KC341_g9926 [Hortaea werneckii]
MSLRLSHLIKRTVKTTPRPVFTPTANQTPSLTLFNKPLRKFASYRSVSEDGVIVISASKIPRLPRSGINPQQGQGLCVDLRDGLSEDECKDVATQIETRITEAVAAAYAARSRAHSPQQQVSTDPASGSRAASTEPPTPPAGQQQEPGSEEAESAVYTCLTYRPPHPKFPGIEGTAIIDVRVYSDEDMLPVLVELRDADARITSVFERPEIIDS